MPGLNDLITVWDDSGKKKLRKYYLTMFSRDVHEVYYQAQDNPVSLSTFCDLHPKNAFLLADSPKNQCRCLMHENVFLKLMPLASRMILPFAPRYYAEQKTIVNVGILDAVIGIELSDLGSQIMNCF